MNKCLVCNNKKFYNIINLNTQPWCGDFVELENLKKIKKYPLNLILCKKCKLAQLDYFLKKEVMFSDNIYLTGQSIELIDHFKKIAKIIKKRFKFNKKSKILDIGSNDGTFLKNFNKKNILGFDPGRKISKIANDNGIKTVRDYFNFNSARKIKYKFDFIHAAGVLFHLEELHSVLKGIKFLLKKKGILVVEFLYLKQIIDKCFYDQIYHEHLIYYNLETLEYLLNIYDLEIFDAHLANVHGGQMICYIANKNYKVKTKRFNKLINLEKKLKVNSINYFKNFVKKVKKNKIKINHDIKKFRKNNKIICCLGAPAKGNTLLNYCSLNSSHIDLMLEKNILKCNKYSPGSNIPIIEENKISFNPDIMIVLIWNLNTKTLKKLKNKFPKTKFYFPHL